MADFTNKAAMGTQRINPSSMVPGARGNAPQGGFRTQMKRSPSGGAEGSGAGAPMMSQYNQLAQQLAQATPTPPPNAQQATGIAPQQGVMPSQAPVIPRVTIPTAPQSMIPQSLQNFHANPTGSTYPQGGFDPNAKRRGFERVSSNPNGPTPIHHLDLSDSSLGVPITDWWENKPSIIPSAHDQQTMLQEQLSDPSEVAGAWVLGNGQPIRSQSNLPPEKQQMLGTAKKGRSFKADDFNMLSAIFKTLGEQ